MAIIGMQQTDAQFFKDAKKLLNSKNKGLTEKDAADGIKNPLINGTDQSVKLVLVVNGYWGNPEVKFITL